MREPMRRPANFYEKPTCPKCGRKTLDYNQYHHWENCGVCGYIKKGVYK